MGVAMNHRFGIPRRALAGILGVVCLAVVSIQGQTPPPSAKSTGAKATGDAKAGTAPKTPWGDPDLQGTWFVLTEVPLERSAANAGKEFLTDQEVAAADEKKGLNPGRNARSGDKS